MALSVAILSLPLVVVGVCSEADVVDEHGSVSVCRFQWQIGDTPSQDTGRMLIEPWGEDSLRVRIPLSTTTVRDDIPGALIKPVKPKSGDFACAYSDDDSRKSALSSPMET